MKTTFYKAFALFLTITIVVIACKKDEAKPDAGREEGKKIEQALLGKKYKIESILNQNGTDASSQFPMCILDDRYLIKTTSLVEITQGSNKCGNHAQDIVSASWGIGYNENTVNSIFFPVYENNSTTYKEKEFLKGLYVVNTETGEINLIYKVDVNTYTIKLKQTL